MPTPVTHAAIPLTLAIGLGTQIVPPRLIIAGVIYAIIPDLDVLAFKFGIRYADILGHRGWTHSLLIAVLLPMLTLPLHRWFKAPPWRVGLFLTTCLLSHTLLDAMTRGGLGVAWYWPWSEQRHLLPWHEIKAAPFHLQQYLTPYGISVIVSELKWVWLPAFSFASILIVFRKYNTLFLAKKK